VDKQELKDNKECKDLVERKVLPVKKDPMENQVFKV